MSVNVVTNVQSANLTKNYRFTIFESHAETLSAIKDQFKYGEGIYWNPNVARSVTFEVVEA